MNPFALLAAVTIAQAVQNGVATRAPVLPERLFAVAWQRHLVPPQVLEWRAEELGGPAVDPTGGLVVVGTRDGWLHAFDAQGARIWEFQAQGRFDAAPRIDGDTVYVGSSDGFLYAVELATGRLRWKYEAREEVGTTPTVAGGLVVFMTLQGSLIAVDQQAGAWKWHYRREVREGFSIRGAAGALASGTFAIGGFSDGTVAAVELASGTVKWERKVAPAGDFTDVGGLQLQSGRLFAAAYSGAVYALDVESGKQLWERKAPGAYRLAVGPGLLVAITTSQVLGIAPQDGKALWNRPLDGSPTGDPIVFAGKAAVPNGKGILFLEAIAGHLLQTLDPGTGVSSPVAWRGRRIYVLSNVGDLVALDFP